MKFDSQILFLNVKDLRATSSFYEKVLRFRLVLDQGKCRIYKTPADSYIGFCEKEKFSICDNVIITFVTDNVDEVFNELKNSSAVVEKHPAFNEEYKIYKCFIKDPDGYLIEIQRFETPEWNANK